MTSDGHVLTRRALERGTANQIRAIVAELPRPPGLEDALAICLALLDREPGTYPRAAAKWASRFAIEHRLTLTDAQLALAALAALPIETARVGVEALIELPDRYRLQRIDELLTTWSERRGLGRYRRSHSLANRAVIMTAESHAVSSSVVHQRWYGSTAVSASSALSWPPSVTPSGAGSRSPVQ